MEGFVIAGLCLIWLCVGVLVAITGALAFAILKE